MTADRSHTRSGARQPRRVVVTGAGGYVGSRLVPHLLDRGDEVVATFTRPGRAGQFWWHDQVDVVGMDVADPEQVAAAVEGADVVVYLVHAMTGRDFVERDREGALTMAHACAEAGVDRIVYLSGLIPDVDPHELSDHLASRLEVESLLAVAGVPTIALRAAMIIGGGSTSFEIVRQLSSRLPVTMLPHWLDQAVQPIAVTDVLDALVAAMDVPAATRHYDVGGPERLTYGELLRRYAEVAGVTRPQVPLIGIPRSLIGIGAAVLTDAPPATVQALFASLSHEMVCRDEDAREDLFHGRPAVTLREAMQRALDPAPEDMAPELLDPMGRLPGDPDWTRRS